MMPGPEDRDDHDREQQDRQREDDVHEPHDRDLDRRRGRTRRPGRARCRRRWRSPPPRHRSAATGARRRSRRDRMSRPMASVPSGYAHEPPACHAGGFRNTALLVRSGGYGAITRREHRHQHDHDDEDQARDRAVVCAEVAPELAQRTMRMRDLHGHVERRRVGGHDLRIRGLIMPYVTSTSRLTAITTTPSSSTPPCSTG